MKKHVATDPRASVSWPALPIALFVLLLSPTAADASPLFGVGDCQGCMSWDAARAAGRVQQASAPTTMENQFYATQTPDYAYTSNMELFVNGNVEDNLGVSHEALVMSWQAAANIDSDNNPDNDLTFAAWEYVYDVDPDLTGTLIEFSILFPPGIWDFSIELEDANGLVRGWFVDPTIIPGLGFNVWHTLALNPALLAPQGFIPGPIQDPGFDLTQVLKIRLDEAGMNTAVFPAPPAGGAIVGQWNAWNHLRVTAIPEPATPLLAGLALLVVGFLRRGPPRR